MAARPTRIVVGVTGATGIVLAVRVLELFRDAEVETHLIVSSAARRTLAYELPDANLEELASVVHPWKDIGAPIASGSFPFDGMIVVPCSVKSLASIAAGTADNLIGRAADVTLKERRRLVLSVRETPLHLGHLRAMQAVTEYGGIITAPIPAWYAQPESVQDIIDHTATRLVGLFGIETPAEMQWQGAMTPGREDRMRVNGTV